MRARILALLLATTAAHGCALADAPPAAPGAATLAPVAATLAPLVRPPALPAGPVPDQPWAETACPTARPLPPTILACIDGAAVTRVRFDTARAAHPPQTPAAVVIQALVDELLLARAAGQRGGWSAARTPLHRQAMVAQLLVETLEKGIGPAQVSDQDVQTAYRNPAIRRRYDRATAYFVTDVQLLCCRGDWRQCEKREEVLACIDQKATEAAKLHAAILEDPPGSGLELAARIDTMAARFPTTTVGEVTFFYDASKPYAEQKGYDLMVQPFAEAVVQLQPGQFAQAPIRSPFGWHLPRLDKVDPGVRRPWNHPEVRKEIRENILVAVREREAQVMAFGWMKAAGVQFFFDRL